MLSRTKYLFSSKFYYKNNIEIYKNLFIIIIFIALPFIFFKDSILLNKVLYGPRAGDTLAYYLPIRDFLINSYKNFEIPLWNPYNFNGVPFFADAAANSLNFINIILGLILPNLIAYNLSIFFNYSLAGIFTYFFIRQYNLSRISAFTSGLMFMFSGFMVIRRGHPNFIFSVVWLPLILFLLEKYIKTRNKKYIIFGSIVLAIQFFSGYAQIFLYSSSVVFLYIIFSFFKVKKFKELKSGLRDNLYILNLLLIFISGILLISIQFIPAIELIKLGLRDKISYDAFAAFSFNFSQIPMLFFPYIYGKVNINQLKDVTTIFNGNYSEMGMYLGIFPFFLSIIGFLNKNKWRIFWGLIAFISILLVFGRNLPFYKLTYYIPAFNIFRISTRHWVEFCFAFSILGGFGMEYIIKSKYKDFRKATISIISLISFFLIGFFLFYFYFKKYVIFEKPYFLNFDVKAISKSFSINKSSIYISLILFACCLMLFIFFIILKKTRPNIKRVIFLIIPIFIFIDLFTFAHNYEQIGKIDVTAITNKDIVMQDLKKDKDLFRIYSATGYSIYYESLSYNINLFSNIYSISGYYPLYLRDYNKIVALDQYGGNSVPINLLISNNNILSICNCKYILITRDNMDNINKNVVPENEFIVNNYEVKKISDEFFLLKNKKFLPRFYFIKDVINVNNVDEVRNKLWDNTYDPSDKALVENYDLRVSRFNNYGLNNVNILKYENNFVDLKVNMKEDGYLVFSDTYYPGWRAYIDHMETKIYKTNGIFKGIYIPKGEHNIRFRFLPNSFLIGAIISGLTFIILIVFLAIPFKKNRKIKEVEIKL